MSSDNDIKSEACAVSFIVLVNEGLSTECPSTSTAALKSLAGGRSSILHANTGGWRLFIRALFCRWILWIQSISRELSWVMLLDDEMETENGNNHSITRYANTVVNKMKGSLQKTSKDSTRTQWTWGKC